MCTYVYIHVYIWTNHMLQSPITSMLDDVGCTTSGEATSVSIWSDQHGGMPKSWLARWWGIMFLCERTMNQSKQCLPMNLVSFLFHTRAWHKQRNHHHRPLRALRALRAPAHPDVKWANRLVWKWGVAVQGITMVVSPNPYKLGQNPCKYGYVYCTYIYIYICMYIVYNLYL